MSSDFTQVKVVDFLDVTDYVANGSFASLKANVTYRDEPDYAILVRLADHNSGWEKDFVYVDKASYNFLRKSSVNPGDVIISNVGANAGTVFRAPNLGIPMTLGPNSVLLMPKEDKPYLKDYVYYYFSSPKGQHLLKSILSGSAQPKFNKTDLRSIYIDVPENGNYAPYARPLRLLDEKLNINTQLNQTLEQIAQAIFKSWFVDFEPVKAKIAVLEAGLPAPVRISGGPREGIFCTYVIECDDGSYYIGQTDNLKRRWREHLSGKGAQWTRTHKPLQIAHFEENSSREEAAAKEKNWKTTSGRRELKKLIASGAARQAGGTAEQAELAAMSVISAKDEAALKQLQAEQPDAYAELAQTAALFPSAMVDSELGEIPEGWEITAISEFGKVVCGKTPSKKKHEYYGSDAPFIKIPDMHGNVFATNTSEFLSAQGAASQPKKAIPKGSVCVSCIATVGQVVIASKESHTNQQINSIVPAKESYTPYLYFSMKMKYKLLHDLASGGSTTLNLNTGNFSKIKTLLPKESALNAYQRYALPLLTTIYENVCQNHALSDTRNSLLPKLLAGHLPITNTEVA